MSKEKCMSTLNVNATVHTKLELHNGTASLNWAHQNGPFLLNTLGKVKYPHECYSGKHGYTHVCTHRQGLTST